MAAIMCLSPELNRPLYTNELRMRHKMSMIYGDLVRDCKDTELRMNIKTYSGSASSLYRSCLEPDLPITRRYLLLCPFDITVTGLQR